MAKKPKQDQLSVVGVMSAILRNTAQQRSMAKGRDKRNARLDARRHPGTKSDGPKKPAKPKKPKDTRTPDEIGATVNDTRGKLVDTVDAVKYDLDVPARLRDLRDKAAARVPRSWRGEPRATISAAAVLVVGWGGLLWAAIAGSKRDD